MTFNDGARSGGPRASRRGRSTGIALGGGGLGVVAILLISQLLGVDLTGLLSGGGVPDGPGQALTNCETGADANADVACRVDFTAQSLDEFWEAELGSGYTLPDLVLFEGSVSTGCGGATSAVGPFYCPADSTVYLDTSFYDALRSTFGASGGSLAQMYVVAHEWGHHIQNITGVMDTITQGERGAASDSVRLELQADCFAGAWAGGATQTFDANGTPFLQPITREQVADALDAAAAIGDDRIQEASGAQVDPHSWSHGSSEQRQRWFETGYERGAGSCDTFAAAQL